MSGEGDVTTGELVRRIDELVRQLDGLVKLLGDDYVRRDVFEEYKKATTEVNTQNLARISKLESWQEWIIRAVLGGVVAAVLSVVFYVARGTGSG
jgi:hypothetical protein